MSEYKDFYNRIENGEFGKSEVIDIGDVPKPNFIDEDSDLAYEGISVEPQNFDNWRGDHFPDDSRGDRFPEDSRGERFRFPEDSMKPLFPEDSMKPLFPEDSMKPHFQDISIDPHFQEDLNQPFIPRRPGVLPPENWGNPLPPENWGNPLPPENWGNPLPDEFMFPKEGRDEYLTRDRVQWNKIFHPSVVDENNLTEEEIQALNEWFDRDIYAYLEKSQMNEEGKLELVSEIEKMKDKYRELVKQQTGELSR